MSSCRFIVGDTLSVLRTLPASSVDLVATSPPFLAQRDYLTNDDPNKSQEIGNERTPGEYVDVLARIVEECGRVLTPHGSIAFELGDSYSGTQAEGSDYFGVEKRPDRNPRRGPGWPEAKSACLVPHLFAITLAYGMNPLTVRTTPRWKVRNVVAWCHTNPRASELRDKWRPATSYITVACKQRTRYFDTYAVRRDAEDINSGPLFDNWSLATAGYRGAHFASWPEELARRLILSMVPERVCTKCGRPVVEDGDCTHKAEHRRGVVLDPFAGTGTTGAVAAGHGRDAILIDFDKRNADLARERIGLFLSVEDFEPDLFTTALPAAR